MELSREQEEAFVRVSHWFEDKTIKTFTIAGYAGTGKTTLASHIANKIAGDDVIFCAYTGKAAKILGDKGCQPAGTIHSYLYKCIKENEKFVFRLDHDSPLKHAKLVIIDEYSMISDEIEKRRWLYTAITRGSKKVTLVD